MECSVRLANNKVEFEMQKDTYMTSVAILKNVTQFPTAFKFKATNPNVFLVKPAIGVLQPDAQMTINFTLHHKVFEGGIQNFNEKLQILSSQVSTNIYDVEQLFQDKQRKFETQKISIVLMDRNRQILAQSLNQHSHMFQSINKQNGHNFGTLEPNRELAVPNGPECRVKATYFSNQLQQLQQESLQKEQELSQIKSDIMQLQQNKSQVSNKSNTLIYIGLFLISFAISMYNSEFIINNMNNHYKW